LLSQTDHLLLMVRLVRRRVADLWHMAAAGVDTKLADWAGLYQLPGELGSLASDAALSSDALREQLGRIPAGAPRSPTTQSSRDRV
jgi:hypothetical protein